MARIPLFPLATMTDEQKRVYDAVVRGPRGVVVGPLRAALHRPELAERWSQFGEILRYRTSLPPRLSDKSRDIVVISTVPVARRRAKPATHESVDAGTSEKAEERVPQP